MKKISKNRQLDQFYTKRSVAIECYEELDNYVDIRNCFLVEPSAGSGSFSNLFHSNSIAMDLDPKNKNIKKCDYLEFNYEIELKEKKDIVVIGNPPFGKNSSLAVSFFNKSAEYSDVIAFIVPKTFKKESLMNRLSLDFHLKYSKDMEKDSFIFNDEKYDVPCVFQIWMKEKKQREKVKNKKTSHLFEFVTKDNADFAVRRVGGLAGKVLEDFRQYQPSSHYYIKAIKNKNELILLLKSKYDELQIESNNTAGNPSLSKTELIKILES